MKKKLFIILGVIVAVAVALLITFKVGNERHEHESTTSQGGFTAGEEVKLGDTIEFGSYEQDNNLRNGKEPLEWIVLADNGRQYTLISLKGLDAVAFALEKADTTWETSYVRSWLNDSFYQTAFSKSEQEYIEKMTLANTKNPTFGTDGGNETKDYVYLMSIDEYNELLFDTGKAPCAPTDYAVAQGVKPSDSTGRHLCSWWLRTPGDELIRAAAFYNTNEAFYGSTVNTASNAIRPMITVNYN